MKKLFYTITILTALLVTACSDDEYVFDKDKYVYDIPDVPVTEDYVIGALYEELGGKYWTEKDYTGTSLLGEYDMKDDYQNRGNVLRRQLDYAKKAGIDFFIIGWNGHASDTLLWHYERTYQSGDPKVVLRFECGHLTNRQDSLHKAPSRTLFIEEADSIYNHVVSKPYYYRLPDNRPAMVLNSYARTKSIVSTVEDFKGGKDIYMIADLSYSWTSPEMHADTIQAFNSCYQGVMATSNYDRNWSYYSYIDYNYNYWVQKLTAMNKEFIPTVHPGYDNKAYDPTSKMYELEREKEVYKTFANVGKRNVGKYRIILVNSWNNYREGTGLEPTEEFKETYLDYTKEFFKKN